MICSLKTLGISGIQGNLITAECYISNGLPGFDIVGLPDAAVKEARDRVRAAAKSSGLTFPVSRITVNLAPASLKKAGTHYDLPILLSILAASGSVRRPKSTSAFVGEVGLDGSIRSVSGVLPMALEARRAGIDLWDALKTHGTSKPLWELGCGVEAEHCVSALDLAKGMLDFDLHPPTMYFPLIVHEALMVEPCETESKEMMDEVCDIYLKLHDMAYNDPEALHTAPHKAPVRRLDEVGAARNATNSLKGILSLWLIINFSSLVRAPVVTSRPSRAPSAV